VDFCFFFFLFSTDYFLGFNHSFVAKKKKKNKNIKEPTHFGHLVYSHQEERWEGTSAVQPIRQK